MNAREEFIATMNKIKALQAEGTADATRAAEMHSLLGRAKELKGVIESEREADDLNDWANRSAGMMRLTDSGADVVGFTPAGASDVTINGEKPNQVRLAEEYGEGIVEPRLRALLNSKPYKQAFRAYLRTPGGYAVEGSAMRTLQDGADSAGGFLIPEDLLNTVISREPAPTRLAGRITQLQTSRDALSMPRVVYETDDKYTTGIRVVWTGENTTGASQHRTTDPVFGRVQIPVFTAMLSLALTNDIIEDAAFPLLSYVAGKFGETVELLKEDMTLNGSGVGMPTGIITQIGNSANHVAFQKTGTDGSLAPASGAPHIPFAKLAMSLPEQYDDAATWVFNKTSTGSALAQIVDSNNRPLWGQGVQDAGLVPGYIGRMLVGYPTILSAFAPDVATSNYPMIFGDLRGYFMVNRVGFSIQILRERYAEENQVVVLGRLRFGGQVVEPWKIKALQAKA